MSVVTISRDPFARTELVRAVNDDALGCECTECGGVGRFRYGTLHDDRPGRIEWAEGRFCGVVCFREYHDQVT